MTTGLLFLNFGGPTNDEELTPFLRNLLADVLPGPPWFKRLAAQRLAPLRAKAVRDRYAGIGWSPVVADTIAQMNAVLERLGPDAPPAEAGMMFSEPSIDLAVGRLLDRGVDKIVALGLFPHWSFATSAAAYQFTHEALERRGAHVPVHYARAFFDDPLYVQAVAATIRATSVPGEGPVHLVFSAHGLPVSFVKRGDPYPDHVQATVRAVVRQLGWEQPWHLSWQSRLGPVRWLGPSTLDLLDRLAAEGAQRVLVVPISFVGEHIETLDELDQEVAEHAHKAGIPHWGRAPALGLEPLFLDAVTALARETLTRFDQRLCARCVLPKPVTHHHEKKCPDCGFQPPGYLRAAPQALTTTR